MGGVGVAIVTYEFTQEIEFEVEFEMYRCANCPYNDLNFVSPMSEEFMCLASGGEYVTKADMLEACPLIEV
jgi:hypothetical protein